jgi:Zn-dependent protease with chaperone function
MNPEEVGDWPWIATIAHKIGHFQNGHIVQNNLEVIWFGLITRKRIELQADYFAGYTLAFLGANKLESLAYFNVDDINFTSSFFSLYPPVEERIFETQQGWMAAMNVLTGHLSVSSD